MSLVEWHNKYNQKVSKSLIQKENLFKYSFVFYLEQNKITKIIQKQYKAQNVKSSIKRIFIVFSAVVFMLFLRQKFASINLFIQ